MNNEEAEIVVGENRPYLTSSRLDSAGNPINTFDYRDVGIKLKVKPYINKDGLVYLTLYQEVTKVTQATVGTGYINAARANDVKKVNKDDGGRERLTDHRHQRTHPGRLGKNKSGHSLSLFNPYTGCPVWHSE